MLSKKDIIIFYFSGTGNTLLIAKEIKKIFEENNYNVVLKDIIQSEDERLEGDFHLGIVVPVAMQSTYKFIWEFVENLPKAKGRKIFFADTLEIFSGGIVGPMKKILEDKGYNCIGAKEFKMSTSMLKSEEKLKKGKIKNKKAISEVEEFVLSIIKEENSWKRIPIFSDKMKSILDKDSIWKEFSEKISIDNDKCIKCKICIKNCPVNAIKLEGLNVKINHNTCISCMRCVNYCPKNAFKLNGKNIIQKQVISLKELV